MLTVPEIETLRDALKHARRPIIFFDDDTDGLSSFLLFYHYARQYAEDIKGVIVKSTPELNGDIFLQKIEEYMPDVVFVLDKPLVHQDFIDRIKQPIYWLDHHPMVERQKIHYFNPLRHAHKDFQPDNRPTTYWAYKIVEEPIEDQWIAMVGCIGDWFIPEFMPAFAATHPDLIPPDIVVRNPGTILHETGLGRLCRILQFNLKSVTKQAMSAVKVVSRISDPYEILEQTTPQGKYLYKHYQLINEIFERIKQSVKIGTDDLILFEYEDKYSLTADLSNEVQYYHPKKVIVIARCKDGEMKCSLRSEEHNVQAMLKKALVGVEGYGGGHVHACGACIKKTDFPKFIEQLRAEIALVN